MSRQLPVPELACALLAALILPGCASSPTPSPQATNTIAPLVRPPQASTSAPTQPTGSPTSYVAFASGLASNFTKGDICSLETPFLLEGDALPVSSGLVASFTPSSATQGSYTFTNNILDGECVDSSDGTYAVTFYSLGEGDIIMTGLHSRVCKGVTVFSQTSESRIAIREAPGITCP